MFLHLSLFSLLAIVAANTVPTPELSGEKIAHGHEVSIEEVPHQVFLHSSDGIDCGGSIISDRWVITAAQCIPKDPDFITVRAGSAAKWSGGSVHVVAQTIVHKNYTVNADRVPINDVALLEIRPPFQLDKTRQPIPMFEANEMAYPGINATISGWGVSGNGPKLEVLQAVQLPIISKKACDDFYDDTVLPEKKICAGLPLAEKGPCKGDQGGPVTIWKRLAGVMSWSNGCGSTGYPSVHTEVAAFNEWISSNTGLTS
ncbi:trypsin-1-like [Andrena cerasifolii]|uniref:trypsin-1-like n=1 Tax=Andrena cerasifolii TaxID=2819439 RepID=UPI004037841A